MGYTSHLAVSWYDSAASVVIKYICHDELSSPILPSRSDKTLDPQGNDPNRTRVNYVQLGLSFLWNPIFFGTKNIR